MDLLEILLTIAIGYFIIYFLWWFYLKQFVVLSECRSGTLPLIISPDKLKGNLHSNSYSYSIWFFVTDWSYKLTTQKIVLIRRSANGSVNPKIYFDPYENNLSVSINTYTLPPSSSVTESFFGGTPIIEPLIDTQDSSFLGDYPSGSSYSQATIEDALAAGLNVEDYLSALADPANAYFDQGGGEVTGTSTSSAAWLIARARLAGAGAGAGYTGAGYTGAGYTGATGASGASGGGSGSAGSAYNCKINNFPLQRWVNLIVSLNNRTLDLYLNGKLVRTCLLPATAIIDANASVALTPDGGFKGWTSNIQYFSKSINPNEAFNIYSTGPRCGGRLSLFDRYKLKLTYLVNNEDAGSVTI